MCRDCDNCTVVYVANALFANDLKVVSRFCWVSSQTGGFRLIRQNEQGKYMRFALLIVPERTRYIHAQRSFRFLSGAT